VLTSYGRVKKQPQVHVDESWPVLGLKEWLWVSAGQNFCLFHAGDNSLVPNWSSSWEAFDGVISSDDSVSTMATLSRRRNVSAHLRRHFKKVANVSHGNNLCWGKCSWT